MRIGYEQDGQWEFSSQEYTSHLVFCARGCALTVCAKEDTDEAAREAAEGHTCYMHCLPYNGKVEQRNRLIDVPVAF